MRYFVINVYSRGVHIFKSTPLPIEHWERLTLKKKVDLIYKTCFSKLIFKDDCITIQELNCNDVPIKNLLNL
jgi:hypothetical protein